MSRFRDTVTADLRRHDPQFTYTLGNLLRLTGSRPGALAVYMIRLQQSAVTRKRWPASKALRMVILALTGADIVPGSSIGEGLLMEHPVGIVIGGGAVIGRNCTILQNVTIGERNADGRPPHIYPRLHDGVVVGAGASVLGNVQLGAGSRIGANAVVLCDVPAGAMAIGIPARVITPTQMAVAHLHAAE